jgi:hypothetical protein
MNEYEQRTEVLSKCPNGKTWPGNVFPFPFELALTLPKHCLSSIINRGVLNYYSVSLATMIISRDSVVVSK